MSSSNFPGLPAKGAHIIIEPPMIKYCSVYMTKIFLTLDRLGLYDSTKDGLPHLIRAPRGGGL